MSNSVDLTFVLDIDLVEFLLIGLNLVHLGPQLKFVIIALFSLSFHILVQPLDLLTQNGHFVLIFNYFFAILSVFYSVIFHLIFDSIASSQLVLVFSYPSICFIKFLNFFPENSV